MNKTHGRKRVRQWKLHAFDADARGKIEKILISKKNCGEKKYVVNCGLGEKSYLLHLRMIQFTRLLTKVDKLVISNIWH